MTARAALASGYWYRRFRATLSRMIQVSVVNPLLYLGALGLGLGSYIGTSAGLGDVPYVTYLAPGLLAGTAVQVAAQEAMFPVHAALVWNRTYLAQQATPLDPGDVVDGHLAWIVVRLLITTAPFVVFLPAFGAFRSPLAVLAVPAAILTGAAFAAPLAAWSVTREREGSFVMITRFVIAPLYLLSGVFAPVAELGPVVGRIVPLTPLFHGVELCRGLALDQISWWPALGHSAYLVAMAGLGVLVARRAFVRRLTER